MKKQTMKFLGEMVPVVVGILIALVINNWQEKNNDQRFIDKTLSSISQEIAENKEELNNSIQEHEMLLDTINHYLQDEEVLLGDILQKVEGIRVVAIKNTAWRSFLNAKMELIDYDLIKTLTNIDVMKQAMQTQVEKMIDFLYANSTEYNYNKKLVFQLIIGDLLHSERTLLEDHEEFLKVLALRRK